VVLLFEDENEMGEVADVVAELGVGMDRYGERGVLGECSEGEPSPPEEDEDECWLCRREGRGSGRR